MLPIYLNLPNKDSWLKLPSLTNKTHRGFETPYYPVLKLQRRDKLSLPGPVKAFSTECVFFRQSAAIFRFQGTNSEPTKLAFSTLLRLTVV